MTPIEKAQELVDNFYQISGDSVYDGITKGMAKRCALIAVDEIIKANPYEVNKTDMDSTIDYWMEVKQEIKNL